MERTNTQNAMRALINDSKKSRLNQAPNGSTNTVNINDPIIKETSAPSKENRKEQLKIGNIILEYEKISSVEVPEERTIEDLKKRGGQYKPVEEKVKPIKAHLSPKYFKKFNDIERPKKFRHTKAFGNSRKLISIIDKIEKLEAREKRRVDALRKVLRDFHGIRKQYQSYFKRNEKADYVAHFLDELKKKYNTINYVYHALSYRRDEIDEYLSKDESDALSFALYMSTKEESGELKL
jgi:hypothetical protein